MPRVIVSADPVGSTRNKRVLLDEEVRPEHLDDEHTAIQLLERLAWAIGDANRRVRPRRSRAPRAQQPTVGPYREQILR